MKRIALVAAALALALQSSTATAAVPMLRVSAGQFFSRCANPLPGREREVVAMCQMYVAGIADGLQTTGNACVDARYVSTRPFPFALYWIRTHWAYANWNAGVMIRNALEYAYPCRATNATQRRMPTLQEQMATVVKIVEFMKAAQWLVTYMGL